MQEEVGKPAFSILSLLACLLLVRLLASADTMSFFKKTVVNFWIVFMFITGVLFTAKNSLSVALDSVRKKWS